jgi:ubiquinone/menaquinone biosynthesis C-methylase UbiE
LSFWGNIFAAGYDHFMAPTERAGLARHRALLLEGASGRVLEIGSGTGANLPYYDSRVSELVLAEPEEPMARRLERKLARASIPGRVLRAPAESLPVESGTFDCVVSTLVLCTVEDPARALAEVHRVLAPHGRLLLIEHVRSQDPALARWQDRLHRPWRWFGHGCNCNRSTLETLRAAGFSVGDLRRDSLPKVPPLVRPLLIGVAARA